MEEKRMTFGEHLDELRWTLIKCVIVLGVVFLVLFFWAGTPVLNFLSRPLQVALDEIAERNARRADKLAQGKLPQHSEPKENAPSQNGRPQTEPTTGAQQKPFIVTSPLESFATYLKVCVFASILLASPIIAYFIWQFVSAGLYAHERRWVVLFAPASFVCFISGAAFFYFVVCPYGLQFLLSFGPSPLIEPRMRIKEYVSFLLTLSLIMGLVFELPLVMVFLTKLGIVEIRDLNSKRRYAYLFAFVLAAVLTPGPDPFTQASLAIPLIVLYELGILLSKIALKGESAKA